MAFVATRCFKFFENDISPSLFLVDGDGICTQQAGYSESCGGPGEGYFLISNFYYFVSCLYFFYSIIDFTEKKYSLLY